MSVIVDRNVEFYGRRSVDAQTTPLQAVQRAYNEAISQAVTQTREPLQVEVVIRVAPLKGTGTQSKEPS